MVECEESPFFSSVEILPPCSRLNDIHLAKDSSFHFVPFRMTLHREDCEKDIFHFAYAAFGMTVESCQRGGKPDEESHIHMEVRFLFC